MDPQQMQAALAHLDQQNAAFQQHQQQILDAQAQLNGLVANLPNNGGGGQQQGVRNVRKELEKHTNKIHPCDGRNREELRSFLEKIDNMQVWTRAGDQEMIRALGPLMIGNLGATVSNFIFVANNGNNVTWDDVKAEILRVYLGEDEPKHRRDMVNQCRQGLHESVREYGRRFQELTRKAYTAQELQDPIRRETLMHTYINGIMLDAIRAQTHIDRPADLQAAIDHSITISRAMELAMGRTNGAPFTGGNPPRQEEGMEMGALDQKPSKLTETLAEMSKTLKAIQDEIKAIKGGTSPRVPLATPRPRTDFACYKCGGSGHYRRSCPNKQGGGDRPSARPLPTISPNNNRLQKMEKAMFKVQQQMAALDIDMPEEPECEEDTGEEASLGN